MFHLTFDGQIRTRPELTHDRDGTPRCQFRIAHDRRRILDGQWTTDRPLWVTVTAIGALARQCMTLSVGDTVTVTGRDDLAVWAFVRDQGHKAFGIMQITAADVALSL
ncbi:single-stranded DNA-binding protein [Paractinoplanes toevensis]|uniref:Single-stranded DNA-binding protein n=1 Tax=Paractinoplanes toevensis TaxID=571911 RepID=A0A919WD70_9ACTN|nr:single-stranded DNA-binding protein [Actinoplanes toevensis]GIM98059.1 hypothetical protein Ato02nite_098520 [Actinoplanes toevensis]